MVEDNTLLSSLLKNQGFTNFKRLCVKGEEKPNLFGYIREERFYICDDHLTDVQISSLIGDNTMPCIFVFAIKDYNIYIQDPNEKLFDIEFSNIDTENLYNLVIDIQGHILARNLDYFKSITPFIQICYRPTDFPTLISGFTYNLKDDELKIPDAAKYDGYSTYSLQSSWYERRNGLFINGSYYKEYTYLFYLSTYHFLVHKDDNQSVLTILADTGKIVYEDKCTILWFFKGRRKSGWMMLNFCKKKDKSGFISEYFKFETTLLYTDGQICKNNTPIELEAEYPLSNINCYGSVNTLILECKATRVYSDWIDSQIISLSEDGYLLFKYEGADSCLERCANGLLTMSDGNYNYSEYSGESVSYRPSYIMDTHGNRIAEEVDGMVVFEHRIYHPVRYNRAEIAAHPDYAMLWDRRGAVYERLYGVLDTDSGEVIVPPIYSHIYLTSGYTDNQGKRKYFKVAIVSINNYYKGNKTTYQGAYIDDELVIPVGKYKNITPKKLETTLIFIVEKINGKTGVCSVYGSELLSCQYDYIETYDGCLYADGIYFNTEGEILFNSKRYMPTGKILFDDSYGSFAYKVDDGFVFVETQYPPRIEMYDNSRIQTEDYIYEGRHFNFVTRCFERYIEFDNEEERGDTQYNDHYENGQDYDRDTYYALGGDDYEAFKNRGGSIDDMMDGMGF